MYSMASAYSLTADLVFSRVSPTLEDILTVLNFSRAKMFPSKAIFRVILNYIGFSPYRLTLESIPILLYLFDESFGSLFLLPCESVFAWALAPTNQIGVETSLEVLPALIWPWTSALAVGLSLFSAWEFMGKAHHTEVPHPSEPSFLPAAYSLRAFVPKRPFCCDLALRQPFDNLSISRSRHCVDQVPCQEEWQLRNLLEAPGVHVDASELRPS